MARTEPNKSREELLDEMEELSRRLEESEQTLHAIQSGAVDAVVVSSAGEAKIFTLQGAEHPYRVMVETMNEGAVTLAADGTALYCNRCLAALLQVPLEKLLGAPLAPYVAGEDRPAFEDYLKQGAQSSERLEISLINQEGHRVPVLISCCAEHYPGSQAVSIIITDISVRKQAEQALQNETFERLRAVEELRKNEQMLIHQSRQAALGEMIGNIAHQWRQPLNTLGLLVQQPPLYYSMGEVDQQFLDANAKKAMELIEHMSRTIDDFRNFFKPDKEKVPFYVNDEVAKTLSLIEASFREQQIEIVVEAQGNPVVEGYPNEFSQVLLNILMNARDVLAERQVPAPAVAIRTGTANGRAVVTIADNGGGIADAIIDKVFDPYFTTKGPQSGTGVGLFMSKTIIEKNMGGVLSVRNTGAGAEFRIEVG